MIQLGSKTLLKPRGHIQGHIQNPINSQPQFWAPQIIWLHTSYIIIQQEAYQVLIPVSMVPVSLYPNTNQKRFIYLLKYLYFLTCNTSQTT